MQARVIGENAVLVECAHPDEVRAVHLAALREVPRALDVVPGARTVLIDGVHDAEALAAEVPGWMLDRDLAVEGAVVEVPVHYDGADLPAVARLWGVSVEAAVARHREREYRVTFCGFAPGFAYCAGLPEEYAVPRLETPRTRVPAGSVGLADAWTGIYPGVSPGGWQLIGHTRMALWQPDRDPPAVLSPGTRVRFVDG